MCQAAQPACAAQVVWSVLIDAVPTHGRNAQQITGAVQKQIKTYAQLLNEFTSTAKQEAALLVHVQARSWYPGRDTISKSQAVLPRHLYSATELFLMQVHAAPSCARESNTCVCLSAYRGVW